MAPRTAPLLSPWTDERTESLCKLWAAGETGSMIARQLGGGLSRSAVIAKVFRLRLPKRPKEAGDTASKINRASNHQRPAKPRAPTVPKSRPPRDTPQPSPDIIATHPKPWTERRFGECAYPVSGEGADVFSCCEPAPKTARWNYCPAHMRLMTSARTPAQKAADAARRRIP